MASDPRKAAAKEERKRRKAIEKAEKARRKTDAKLVKAGVDPSTVGGHASADPQRGARSSRYADAVRGVLYLLGGGSLLLAVVLGERDVMIGLDDLVDNLIVATVGRILLLAIAVGLAIYGLKKLRLIP